MSFDPDDPINRGRTYTIITAAEDTADYKIGYRHGVTARLAIRGQTDNYKAGYIAGFLARRGEK